jgi:hypothetical protein
MAYSNENTIDRFGGLHAANSTMAASSRLAAGPFDVSGAKRDSEKTSLSDALITGLLVVYPAVATVVAVIVGLYFSSPSAGI